MTNKEFIERISFAGEEWRDVIGYEGIYMISSHGRIYSVRRIAKEGKGYSILKGGKLKLLQENSDGYLKVQLMKDGKAKNHFVHRLVCKSFIPNPYNFPTIDHIDTIKKNNVVSNLKWCTRKENSNNILTRKKLSVICPLRKRKGENNPDSKPVIRISSNGSIKRYSCIQDTIIDGFCRSSVGRVCNKIYKQHKGYKWIFQSEYETLTNMSKNSI